MLIIIIIIININIITIIIIIGIWYSYGQSDASSVMAKCFVCLSPSAFSYHRWLAVM